MKVIITGISSFVGYHLANKLLSRSAQVLGISRSKNENVEDLLSFDNFSHRQLDISENKNLEKISKRADVIFHLAALSSERLCSKDPLQSLKVNVLGTVNMLNVAKSNNSLFIFSSSGSVYPNSEHPKKEEEARFTDKFYGTSKLTAEKYCQLYNKKFDLNYVILRFSRIYGARMLRNPVYDICKALSQKETVKLYESPLSKYDFVFVGDVVRAFVDSTDKKWSNKIVNISSNEETELQHLYEILKGISGIEKSIEVVVEKKGIDILNNDKAKRLGWRPEVSLEEGLSKTYKYFNRK